MTLTVYWDVKQQNKGSMVLYHSQTQHLGDKSSIYSFENDVDQDLILLKPADRDPHCLYDETIMIMTLHHWIDLDRPSDLCWAGSLSHDFKISPITFQDSGPILFSCEKISL